MKARFLFCGDPHGRFDHILQAIQEYQPEAVVMLGDLQPKDDLIRIFEGVGCAVRWIHGNHDTDRVDEFNRVFDPAHAGLNQDGCVEVIAGVRIAGLGGVFRSAIWDGATAPLFESFEEFEKAEKSKHHWKQKRYQQGVSIAPDGGITERDWSLAGALRKHRSSIFPDTVARLSRQQADILVTHEAPSAHRHGFPIIDDLARQMGVRQIFHGHHHESYAARSGDIHVCGVGLREIVDQDGNTVYRGDHHG